MTFSGEKEDIETAIWLDALKSHDSFDQLRVKSSIRHTTLGFIKTLIGNQRQKIDFSEYLQPVDFRAYLARTMKLALFQAPKRVCRGVLANLRTSDRIVDLRELEVDFSKVMKLNEEYLGAWFRGVSSRVRAAGLSGTQIQQDNLFKNLRRVAVLSSVTLPWLYKGADHPVMITNRGGVILVNNYRDNVEFELGLVIDVYQRLLRHVARERKADPTGDEPSTGISDET